MYIDLLPAALLILFLWGAYPVKPISSINRDYLSIDTSKCIRGLLAPVILFHHLAQRVETGVFIKIFRQTGTLAVAVFFFFSGYGLLKSYITKQEKYRKGFLLRRVFPLLFSYAVVTLLYWLRAFLSGTCYSIKDIMDGIVKGSPIVPFSWYILCILSFYVVFWLLMTICRKNYFLILLGSCFWYLLYLVYCLKMGWGWYCYNICPLLVIGMLWAIYEKNILEIMERYYLTIAPVTFLLFCASFLLRGKLISLFPMIDILAFMRFINYALFAAVAFFFLMKIKIGNNALKFLGSISLEIYLAQGLFTTGFRSEAFCIQDDFLWCCAVLAATILFAYLLHTVFNVILKKYRILLYKEGIEG